MKLANLSARKYFLLKCKKNNVFPKHIVNNINCVFQSIEENSPFTRKIDNLILEFKRKLLNIEIRIAFWKIDKLHKENNKLKNSIHSLNSPPPDLFFISQEKKYNNQLNDSMQIVNNKLETLLRNQLTNHIRADTESFIHNATETEIPNDVKFLMGLGPKFGLPTQSREIPVLSILADLEIAITDCIEATERNDIRYTATNVLKKAITNENSSTFDSFLLKKKIFCIEFFKHHPHLHAFWQRWQNGIHE